MNEILAGILVAVVVAVIAYFISYTKSKGYDDRIESIYQRYSLLFKISGELIRSIDETLYKEMEEAIARMKEAYESPDFTKKDLEEVLKECKDVFERVEALIDERNNAE